MEPAAAAPADRAAAEAVLSEAVKVRLLLLVGLRALLHWLRLCRTVRLCLCSTQQRVKLVLVTRALATAAINACAQALPCPYRMPCNTRRRPCCLPAWLQSGDALYGVLLVGRRLLAAEAGKGPPPLSVFDLLLLANFVQSNESLRCVCACVSACCIPARCTLASRAHACSHVCAMHDSLRLNTP